MADDDLDLARVNRDFGQVVLDGDVVLRMLDNIIEFWRESDEDHAEYYVDAYQSMRRNLFGETKPVDGSDESNAADEQEG